jgi:hypothetical protein
VADRPEGVDTDRVIPVVLGYETAWERLLDLLGDDLAHQVWTEVVSPVYDRVAFTRDWSRGQCRRCGVQHPEWWAALYTTKKWPNHRTYCPKYVGPLEHLVVKEDHTIIGTPRNLCSCGKSWLPEQDWGCPDKDVDWRGPRPEPEA